MSNRSSRHSSPSNSPKQLSCQETIPVSEDSTQQPIPREDHQLLEETPQPTTGPQSRSEQSNLLASVIEPPNTNSNSSYPVILVTASTTESGNEPSRTEPSGAAAGQNRPLVHRRSSRSSSTRPLRQSTAPYPQPRSRSQPRGASTATASAMSSAASSPGTTSTSGSSGSGSANLPYAPFPYPMPNTGGGANQGTGSGK